MCIATGVLLVAVYTILIDWLIFIEHKTNVYALVTIEKNFNIYVVQEKNKHKHSYKTKHNALQSYTYLNFEVEKIFYAILVHT